MLADMLAAVIGGSFVFLMLGLLGAYSERNKLKQRIAELEMECFKLSAGVCEYRSGNEHGNPLCLKTGNLI